MLMLLFGHRVPPVAPSESPPLTQLRRSTDVTEARTRASRHRAYAAGRRGNPSDRGNLCKVTCSLHELLELAVGDRRFVDEEWIDRGPMDGRLFRIMLFDPIGKYRRNQDHSTGPECLRPGLDGIVIELNRATLQFLRK